MKLRARPCAAAEAAVNEMQSTLTTINLNNNNIGPAGAKAIAGALASGKAELKSLNVSLNDIGDEGGKAILDLHRSNMATNYQELGTGKQQAAAASSQGRQREIVDCPS